MESKLTNNRKIKNIDMSKISSQEEENLASISSLEHQLLLVERDLEKKNRELFLASEKIKKLEAQFVTVLELFDFACFIFNNEGIIKLVNSKGAELLGRKKEILINKSFFDFIAQSCKSKFELHLQKVLNDRTKSSCDLQIIINDSTIFLINIDSIPSTFLDLNEVGCISMVINKESLEHTQFSTIGNLGNYEIKSLGSEIFDRDKFFSIIAHDLKSPLSGLLDFAEILYNEYDHLSEIEKREYIDHVNTAAKNLNALLEKLLEWSRIQLGGILFKHQSLNVEFEINEVVNLFTQYALNKHIIFNKAIQPNLTIFADKNSFHTILRNLISNAIKFSKDNGVITISATDADDFVKIIVEDTGDGISEENLHKLFRIDQNYTTIGTNQEKGTGLGLLICKDLVKKNGGNITVESQICKGTKMIITLPKPKSKLRIPSLNSNPRN